MASFPLLPQVLSSRLLPPETQTHSPRVFAEVRSLCDETASTQVVLFPASIACLVLESPGGHDLSLASFSRTDHPSPDAYLMLTLMLPLLMMASPLLSSFLLLSASRCVRPSSGVSICRPIGPHVLSNHASDQEMIGFSIPSPHSWGSRGASSPSFITRSSCLARSWR